MGFGADLQGRTSHEALLRLQDTEIRLLENMKKCMTHRIKADRDYTTALGQMVQIAKKFENNEFQSPVFQVRIFLCCLLTLFIHSKLLGRPSASCFYIMNSMKLFIPLHIISWKKDSKWCCDTTTPESIHTKDESKRGSAFALIFGVNWPVQWM